MGKVYAFIENGRVREIIRSEGIFENVPLEDRYAKEVVDCCIECGSEVKEGMDYNYETKIFSEHIDLVEEEEDDGESDE